MNKFILLLFAIFCLNSSLLAQDPVCEPDSTYADSLAGVYPGPFHEVDFPDGGIKDTSCINHPFELVLTAVVNDSIEYAGFDIALNYLKVQEDGILNLPSGMSYACNPPSCQFDANTMGCMLISGTPDETNEVGTYDLELLVEIKVADLFVINDTLPEYLIPGSHYYLVLDPEDSENCQVLGNEEINRKKLDFELLQNPVSDLLKIRFDEDLRGPWKIEIHTMDGSLAFKQESDFHLDDSDKIIELNEFHPGYYIIRLTTKEGMAIKKLIVASK